MHSGGQRQTSGRITALGAEALAARGSGTVVVDLQGDDVAARREMREREPVARRSASVTRAAG